MRKITPQTLLGAMVASIEDSPFEHQLAFLNDLIENDPPPETMVIFAKIGIKNEEIPAFVEEVRVVAREFRTKLVESLS